MDDTTVSDKQQIVINLRDADISALARVVEARRASNPKKHLSRSEIIRQLIREAANPAEMTDAEEHR